MQHFPKNCFHFPESSVKFASSTKNEVRKFGEVRSSSSTEILICNPGEEQQVLVSRQRSWKPGSPSLCSKKNRSARRSIMRSADRILERAICHLFSFFRRGIRNVREVDIAAWDFLSRYLCAVFSFNPKSIY